MEVSYEKFKDVSCEAIADMVEKAKKENDFETAMMITIVGTTIAAKIAGKLFKKEGKEE